MKRNNLKSMVILIVLVTMLGALWGYRINRNSTDDKQNFYVDIDDIVNNLYTSKNGYDAKMEKNVYKPVFEKANVYNHYKDRNYNDDIDTSIILTEINQHKNGSKVYVYMKYDITIVCNDVTSQAWDVPVVFTVDASGGCLYIEDLQEYENEADVPDEYK